MSVSRPSHSSPSPPHRTSPLPKQSKLRGLSATFPLNSPPSPILSDHDNIHSYSPLSLSLNDSTPLITNNSDWRNFNNSRQFSPPLSLPSPSPSYSIGAQSTSPSKLKLKGLSTKLKGLSAEYAPALVISSISSFQNDDTYNYRYSSPSPQSKSIPLLPSNKSNTESKSIMAMTMTNKDRARHGMLRTMLTKQLDVTRPSQHRKIVNINTSEHRKRQVELKGIKNSIDSRMKKSFEDFCSSPSPSPSSSTLRSSNNLKRLMSPSALNHYKIKSSMNVFEVHSKPYGTVKSKE